MRLIILLTITSMFAATSLRAQDVENLVPQPTDRMEKMFKAMEAYEKEHGKEMPPHIYMQHMDADVMGDMMKQQQQMMQNMSPEMKEMLKQQGMDVSSAELQQGMHAMNKSVEYGKCIERKTGQNYMQLSMKPFMSSEAQQYNKVLFERANTLCQAGRKEAAKSYVERGLANFMENAYTDAESAAMDACGKETGFEDSMDQMASSFPGSEDDGFSCESIAEGVKGFSEMQGMPQF